jgi:excisionase family DNA binding protein
MNDGASSTCQGGKLLTKDQVLAPESGWVPQRGLPPVAKPAHSFTSGGALPSGRQQGLAPFDTKRADGKRIGFTVRELAEQLHVSTATVYGWVKVGKLSHLRLGGNVIRIPVPVVERLVDTSQADVSAAVTTPRFRHR